MKRHIFTLIFSFIIFPVFLLAQQTHTISQTGMTFEPPNLSIDLGDTIKWVWTEGTHTTTSTSVPDGAEEWNSPLTSEVTEFKYKVTVPGIYDYHCIPHQAME
jgi:plastocyanin